MIAAKRVTAGMVFLALTVLSACGSGGGGDERPVSNATRSPAGPIQVAAETTPMWAVGTRAETGIDDAQLRKVVTDLRPDHGLHSMLVVRHNKLVMEQYWNGYGPDSLQDIRSATKSITSLLTGIAVDKKLIGSIDEPARTFLGAAYPDINMSNKGFSVRHLLTMSSGLACNDASRSSPGAESNMYPTKDWVRFFLELPVQAPPGAAGYYCTADVVALGRVVSQATKQSIAQFSQENLFGPLGIAHARWDLFDGQHADTGGHLRLRPRDLAAIGQMVLQGGQWKGKQVVSRAWIDESTSDHIRVDNKPYGYLWWRSKPPQGAAAPYIYASGNGGQHIYIVPGLDMVVIFTSGNFDDPRALIPADLIEKVMAAAKSTSS